MITILQVTQFHIYVTCLDDFVSSPSYLSITLMSFFAKKEWSNPKERNSYIRDNQEL